MLKIHKIILIHISIKKEIIHYIKILIFAPIFPNFPSLAIFCACQRHLYVIVKILTRLIQTLLFLILRS